ncbi:MAG TPA: hypothetical protein VI159_10940, partial [Gemmatimonadales bacterium]
PGFARGWPHEMSLDENRGDLERHAEDFRERRGFTYTVLEPVGEAVIGCVYIYPARNRSAAARVLSWVRADRAKLDADLRRTVSDWLASTWPWPDIDYDVPD